MMSIDLNKEGEGGLEKSFMRGGSFQYNTGKSIMIFPFRTKGAQECYEEFRLFHGVVGEVFRISSNLKFDNHFTSDKDSSFNSKLKNHVLNNAIEIVRTENKDELKDTILSLFFGDDGELMKFNGKVLPFMNFTHEHPALNELALFITDVFLDKGDLIDVISQSDIQDNLFYQLIEDCLPKQHQFDYSRNSVYYNALPEIKALFKKDFNLLKKDSKSFIEEIENLFKFYYFFYMTQLLKRLQTFGESKVIEPIFFTMDWESLSGSRLSYQFGWDLLEADLKSSFSHAITLELINFIRLDNQSIGDYVNVLKKYEELEENEKNTFISKVKEVIQFYEIGNSSVFEKVGKEELQQKLEMVLNDQEEEITKLLKVLFTTVSFVIEKTDRDPVVKRYADWIVSFCKVNFTKIRGPLGTTLAMSQEMLLFLVKLCVAENSKIRLNNLWIELENRGIKFDEVSKTEIIRLFERINLLEKKSDSGDAQYVKSII